MTDEKKSLLTFPCEFTIKVFGDANSEFESTIRNIATKHFKDWRMQPPRESSAGKYLCISLTVNVDSKEQLDKIYQELSSHPSVKMAL